MTARFTQQALGSNDSTFSEDELAEATASSFTAIIARMEAQGEVARNDATPEDEAATERLYVSDTGLVTLFGASLPSVRYVPEGDGARARPEDAVVDQVVLHSFGYAIDRVALARGAKSIQVSDTHTGHNPYKVAQRLQQVLLTRNQSTTHLITRRGDIICATPWNRAPAVNAVGAARPLALPERSISIELESWHTAMYVPYRGTRTEDFKVLGRMPYTPAQISSVAFLLKKLGVWSNASVHQPLGFTFDTVRERLGSASGHVPGTVSAATLGEAAAGPGGEWELPPDWSIGDAFPSHVNADLYAQRIQLYYRGLSAGTKISHYNTVTTLVEEVLPTFSYQTEIFQPRAEPVFESTPTEDVGVAAASRAGTNAAGAGYARSHALQQQTRTGMYSAAAIANDAVVRETLAYANRQQAVAGAPPPPVPVVTSALSFDFGRGEWVTATTYVVRGQYTPPAPTPPPRTGS